MPASPRAVVEAWVAAFNAADPDALAALYAPDAVNHQVVAAPVVGREAIRARFAAEFAAAEMTCLPEQILEDGDWAVLEWRDPLGLHGCGFFRVADGRIAFQRGYFDRLSFLRQQGLPLPTDAPSDARAARLVETLGLAPHPEGGFYREVFRSPHAVRPGDGRPDRAALTTIHFLLADGGHSRWHRVASDEAWHFSEGAPLDLFVADPAAGTVETLRLGPVDGAGAAPARVVPAGHWQAARTTGAFTLVGCTVGPGFDFADFEMLADHPDLADAMREHEGMGGLV